MFTEGILLEMGKSWVAFDKGVCGVNHEKETLLRRYIEAEVIKERDAKGPHHRSVIAQFL